MVLRCHGCRDAGPEAASSPSEDREAASQRPAAHTSASSCVQRGAPRPNTASILAGAGGCRAQKGTRRQAAGGLDAPNGHEGERGPRAGLCPNCPGPRSPSRAPFGFSHNAACRAAALRHSTTPTVRLTPTRPQAHRHTDTYTQPGPGPGPRVLRTTKTKPPPCPTSPSQGWPSSLHTTLADSRESVGSSSFTFIFSPRRADGPIADRTSERDAAWCSHGWVIDLGGPPFAVMILFPQWVGGDSICKSRWAGANHDARRCPGPVDRGARCHQRVWHPPGPIT